MIVAVWMSLMSGAHSTVTMADVSSTLHAAVKTRLPRSQLLMRQVTPNNVPVVPAERCEFGLMRSHGGAPWKDGGGM